MKGTTLIALVGAAAWLPQMISWFKSWLVKPKLRFVPEEMTEIGYTFFGPIFNQNFAISTSRKDALVEKITAIVIHESGAKNEFYWKFLNEKGVEITGPTGEIAELAKRQSAIALKVSVLGLTEKKIGFQDVAYQQKLATFIRKHSEKETYLEKSNTPNHQEQAIKTKEFLDTLDFIKTGFCWRVGKYDVCLNVYETTLKKPHVEHYRFELSKSDFEHLEKNIKVTQEHFKDLVLYRGKKLEEWPKRFWNWVNPAFYRAQEG